MLLTRRELLVSVPGLTTIGRASLGSPASTGSAQSRVVQTVTGGVEPDRLGLTLMHEHVLVDFIGADQVSPTRYDPDDVFKVVLPYLTRIRALGCDTFVECTPAYLGRDVLLLKRLSEASGLRILSNTGYYGAVNDKYLPRHAFTETADQLATRWIGEFERGIDGTSIRPALMKIGVDEAPLSAVDAKLVRAAAIASTATGLTIASHTATGPAALAQLEVLDRAGVPAGHWIWVHAQSERDADFHTRVAKAGGWVEFDGVSETSTARHVDLVQKMKAQRLLGRVLVSQDAGWYHVGEPGGGQFRPFDPILTRFVPALRKAGFTEAEIRQLFVDNPRRALTGALA